MPVQPSLLSTISVQTIWDLGAFVTVFAALAVKGLLIIMAIASSHSLTVSNDMHVFALKGALMVARRREGQDEDGTLLLSGVIAKA